MSKETAFGGKGVNIKTDPNLKSPFRGGDVFEQISSAAFMMQSIADILTVSTATEKVAIKLNKKKDHKKTTVEANAPDRSTTYRTKLANINISGNQQSAMMYMAGLKDPFGQVMGGKSCSASMNIITNDPDTIVDILSMFRGNGIYETVGNMMQLARGLLKTRYPAVPGAQEFTQQFANQTGPPEKDKFELLTQLRMLRRNIKANQFIRILKQSVLADEDSGRIQDLFYDQEEPLVIDHPLLNSLGMYTFVPVSIDVTTVQDKPGYLSLSLNCQWVDTRYKMREALRYRGREIDGLAEKGAAWLASLEINPIEDALKKQLEQNPAKNRATVLDQVKTRFNDRRRESLHATRALKSVIANHANSLSSAPVLMVYALSRFKKSIDILKNIYKRLNIEDTEPGPEFIDKIRDAYSEMAMMDRVGFTYNPSKIGNMSGLNIAQTFGTAIGAEAAVRSGFAVGAKAARSRLVAGSSKLLFRGFKALFSGAAGAGTAGAAEVVFWGAEAGLKAMRTYTSDQNKQTKDISIKAAFQGIGAPVTLTATGIPDISDKETSAEDHEILKYFTRMKKGGTILMNVNVPFLMSRYYNEWIVEMLQSYDNVDNLEKKIREWAIDASTVMAERGQMTEDGGNLSTLGIKRDEVNSPNSKLGVFRSPGDTQFVYLISSSLLTTSSSDTKVVDDPDVLDNTVKQFIQDIKKSSIDDPAFDSPQQLDNFNDLIYTRMAQNCWNATKTMHTQALVNLQYYIATLSNFDSTFYRAGAFSHITSCLIHEYANFLPLLDEGVFDANSGSIPRDGEVAKNLIPHAKQYFKVIGPLSSLSRDEQNKVIKRARTLIAYGGNYKKNNSRDIEINNALFNVVRDLAILNIVATLKKHNMFFITGRSQPEGAGDGPLATLVPFGGGNHENSMKYKLFIKPYLPNSESFIVRWWAEGGGTRGLAAAILKGLLAAAVLAVLVIFVKGAIIIAVITILVVVIGGMLIDLAIFGTSSLTDFLDDARKSVSGTGGQPDADRFVYRTIAQLRLNTMGSVILFRMIEGLSEDALAFVENEIFPPEITINNDVSFVNDADTHLVIPLRREKTSSRVYYPGFWIWSERSTHLKRIHRELMTDNLLAELSKTSHALGQAEMQSIYERTVKMQADQLPGAKANSATDATIKIIKLALIRALKDNISKGARTFKTGKSEPRAKDAKAVIQSLFSDAARYAEHYLYTAIVKGSSLNVDANNQAFTLSSTQKVINISLQAELPSRFGNDSKQKEDTLNLIEGTRAQLKIAPYLLDHRFTIGVDLLIREVYQRPEIQAFYNNSTKINVDKAEALLTPFFTNGLVGPTTAPLAANRESRPESTVDDLRQTMQDIMGRANVKPTQSLLQLVNEKAFEKTDGAWGLDIAPSILRVIFSSDTSEVNSWLVLAVDEGTLSRRLNSLARFNLNDKTIQAIKQKEAMLTPHDGIYGDAGVEIFKSRSNQILHKLNYRSFGEKTAKMNPTFKLYFMQENNREWLLMDDFYSYSGVEEIEVYRTAKSPVSTARIVLSNFTNNLSNLMSDRIHRENPLFDDPSILSEISSIMLKPGAKLKVYMGYGAKLTDEDVVFVGEINEMKGDQTKELVCTNYGTLLMEPFGTDIPEVITGSVYDLVNQKNIYSVQEMMIRKLLIDHFEGKIERINGRLGESGLLVGSSSFESNTLQVEERSAIGRIKSAAITSVISTMLTSTRLKNIASKFIQNKDLGQVVQGMSSQHLRSHNLTENIRVINAGINDTDYGIFLQGEFKQQALTAIETNEASKKFYENAVKGTLAEKDWIRKLVPQGAADTANSLYFLAGSLYNKFKGLFGAKTQNIKFIGHDDTYWSFIQEMLLQLPNHVSSVRPYGDRNTIVVTDLVNGYYRTTRSIKTGEYKTLRAIDSLESARASSMTGIAIILESILRPDQDSIALFVMFYIFLGRSLRHMNNISSGTVFYNIPTRNQIEHVIDSINLVIRTSSEVNSGTDGGGTTTKNTTSGRSIVIGSINRIKKIIQENKIVINNSVEARIFLLQSLFTDDLILEFPSKTDTRTMKAVAFATAFTWDQAKNLTTLKPEEGKKTLKNETFSTYTVGSAMRLASERVIKWALQTAYDRSSSHRRLSENHYKNTELDIVTNNINLQKGFNVAEVSVLDKVDDYGQVFGALDPGKSQTATTTFTFRIHSGIKWLNRYRTFVKNPFYRGTQNKGKAFAAMGVQILCNLIRDYYGGSLILVGDPEIKEWDMITLSDYINDMSGSILVNEVIHKYNKFEGFTTTVTPMLPAYNDFAVSEGGAISGIEVVGRTILAVAGTALAVGTMIFVARGLRSSWRGGVLQSLRSSTKLRSFISSSLSSGKLSRISAFADESAKAGTSSLIGRIQNATIGRAAQWLTFRLKSYATVTDNITHQGVVRNLSENIEVLAKNVDDVDGLFATLNGYRDRIRNFAKANNLTDDQLQTLLKQVDDVERTALSALRQDITRQINFGEIGADVGERILDQLGRTGFGRVANVVGGTNANATKTIIHKIIKEGTDAEHEKLAKRIYTEFIDGVNAQLKGISIDPKKIDSIVDEAFNTLKNQDLGFLKGAGKGDDVAKQFRNTGDDILNTKTGAAMKENLKRQLTNADNIQISRKTVLDQTNYKNMVRSILDDVKRYAGSGTTADIAAHREYARRYSRLLVGALMAMAADGLTATKLALGARGASGWRRIFSTLAGSRGGLAGAFVSVSTYSWLNGYLLDAEKAFNGLITDYYGQNAVSVSGLRKTGEPFVANLDGMQKSGFVPPGRDSPWELFTGRLKRNIIDPFNALKDDRLARLNLAVHDTIRQANTLNARRIIRNQQATSTR